jgi:hypothetical protein
MGSGVGSVVPSLDAPGELPSAFGHRPCYRIRAGLARIELQAVFSALVSRFPTVKPAVPVDELQLRTDLLTGGLNALPVTC